MYKTETAKGLSILLIDDDSDYRWLIRDAMNMTDISCGFREAPRAYEALDLLRSSPQHELPDVILVDIEMPGMTGLEFVEELKKSPALRHITTIVVSGVNMQQQDRDEILQKGAAGVVRKTPDIYEMTRRLQDAIDNAGRV